MEITLESMVESMKADVLAMVQSGQVPATCKDFSELHDYCDANVIGQQEDMFEQETKDADGSDEMLESALDRVGVIVNPAQDSVNQWIKSGALLLLEPAR